MYRQIACGAQLAQPNPHGLWQRVCYHSLHNTDAAFALPVSLVSRSRLPQALRYATQKRQREFLAGRWCAEEALQCLGAGSTHVAMAEDRTPIWPDGVVGSITHTDDFAAAAVAWAAGNAQVPLHSEHTDCARARLCIPPILFTAQATPFQHDHRRPLSELLPF